MEQQKVKIFMENFDRREFIQKAMMLLGAGAFTKFMTGCKDPDDEEIDPGNGNGGGNGGTTISNKTFLDQVEKYIKSLEGKGHTREQAASLTVAYIKNLNKDNKKKTRFAADLAALNNQGLVDRITIQAGNSVTDNTDCAILESKEEWEGQRFYHTMQCPTK